MDSWYVSCIYYLVIVGLILAVLTLATSAYYQDVRIDEMQPQTELMITSRATDGLELIFLAGLLIGVLSYGFIRIRRNL